MLNWLAELDRRDRLLSLLGRANLLLAVLLIGAIAVDPRQVLGISVWIKPLKFALSIAIYVWTVAWLLPDSGATPRMRQFIRRGTAAAMIIEIVCIVSQAARGTTSHFNDATSWNGAVFTLMGLAITFNAVLELLLLVAYCRRSLGLAPGYLWGIRWGLVAAILSSGIGFVMVFHYGHAFGEADGGPGLPLVNWSTRAGDLRVAHAMGLHALQALPLVGWLAGRFNRGRAVELATTFAAAALWLGIGGWLFCQALAGIPLLAWS